MTVEEAKYTVSAFRSLRRAVELSCRELDEMKARIEASGGLRAVSYDHVGGSGGKSGGSVVEKLAIDFETMRELTCKKMDELLLQESKITYVVNQIGDMEIWFCLHALLYDKKYCKDREDPRTKQQVEEDAFKAFAEIASAQDTKK